jgi:hypothetical protein
MRERVPLLKEILERLAEQFNNHEDTIMIGVGAEVIEPRDASCNNILSYESPGRFDIT